MVCTTSRLSSGVAMVSEIQARRTRVVGWRPVMTRRPTLHSVYRPRTPKQAAPVMTSRRSSGVMIRLQINIARNNVYRSLPMLPRACHMFRKGLG